MALSPLDEQNTSTIEKTATEIFYEGEEIIEDITINGVTSDNHRKLIQKKTELLIKVYGDKKQMKDKRLDFKLKVDRETKRLIDSGMAKTPARAEADEAGRGDKYDLEKLEIDLELMDELSKNRTYHLRYNEIETNKA